MNIHIQDSEYWIRHLELKPHPEGGFYREIFRSKQEISRMGSTILKPACTSIYYLLEGNDFSGFHRLASDELWYFHKGEPLFIYAFNEEGLLKIEELSDREGGHLSVSIQAGSWFAAAIPSGNGFSLVSCVVAPGFDFNEFEMADKHILTRLFPDQIRLIDLYCR
jgi:predicted cupin superfamily sugar epimerase